MFRFTFFCVALAVSLFTYEAKAQCSISAGNDTTIYRGYAPLSCATITATPNGTAPFTYLWNTGDTTASVTACDTASATYIVSFTDSTGCTASDTVEITVIDVRCGSNNDKVMVCHIPPGNPANAHSICISTHGVPAHLAHGCSLGNCPQLPPPPPPLCSVNLGNDTSLCSGGSIILDAGADFTYLWSDSSIAQTLTITASGTYSVTVSDTTGCSASDSIAVTFFAVPTANAGADTILTAPGCVDLAGSASGGTLPYTFLWSTGDTVAAITVCDSVTTTYTLLVTDSNGCTASDDVTVTFITIPPSAVCDSPKVLVCHIPPGNPGNAHTICISLSALPAHLAHGDSVGPCPNGQRQMFSGFLISTPNPNNGMALLEFTVYETGRSQVEVLNMEGHVVSRLFDGMAEAFVPYVVDFNGAQLPGGIYFARIISGNLTPTIHKMILLNE